MRFIRIQIIGEIIFRVLDFDHEIRAADFKNIFDDKKNEIKSVEPNINMCNFLELVPVGRYKEGKQQVKQSIKIKSYRNGDKIYLKLEYYREKRKLSTVIACYLWREVLKNYLDSETAFDTAFAMVWEYLEEGKRKEYISKLWEERFPGHYELDRNTKLSLKGFITLLKSKRDLSFREGIYRIFPLPEKNRNRAYSLNLIYRSVKLDMSILTPSDLKVWEILVNYPLWNLEDGRKAYGISRSQFQNSKKKLIYLNLVRPSREISPTRLGMRSVIAVYGTSDLKNIERPNFPILNRYYVFANNLRIKFLHFITPHRKKSIKEWIEYVDVKEPYIIGIEEEKLRYVAMRPTLFDLKSLTWETGYEIQPIFPDEIEAVKLTFKERETFLEMFRKDFTKNDIVNALGQRRNDVLNRIDQIEKNKILWRQYQMVMLMNLERFLIKTPCDEGQYIQFIKKFASKVPYAWITYVNAFNGTYLIGLMGISPKSSRGMISEILTSIPDSWVMTLISNPNIHPIVNLKNRKEGWRYDPLENCLA